MKGRRGTSVSNLNNSSGGSTSSSTKNVKGSTKKSSSSSSSSSTKKKKGRGLPKSQSQRRKHKKEDVLYDPSDPSKPFPVGLKLYCKYGEMWHVAMILERKEVPAVTRDPTEELRGTSTSTATSTSTTTLITSSVSATATNATAPIPQSPAPTMRASSPETNVPPALGSQTPSSQTMEDDDDEDGEDEDEEAEEEAVIYSYYVHYLEWDRRMDEWALRDRLCPTEHIHTVAGSSQVRAFVEPAKSGHSAHGGGSTTASHGTTSQNEKGTGGGKDMAKVMDIVGGEAKVGEAGGEDEENSGKVAVATSGKDMAHKGASMHSAHGNFTEEDIKAHEEATKVKNIEAIVLGPFELTTWYYSPFPAVYNQYEKLYFCEFCLSFFGHTWELNRHCSKCKMRHPPGNEIYRSQETNVMVSVFEVDGQKERVYCQNLCYIAKLFLDHKTLEFDCTPFLFYVLTEVDEKGFHVVGYFSKEKVSVAKYNLACILCLPCHQRKGYGKFIISLSYELSKLEDKVGSPEKPISDLGKVSYMSYWTKTLITILKQRAPPPPSSPSSGIPMAPSVGSLNGGSGDISIDELSRMTCITTADIIETLKFHKVLVWHRGRWALNQHAIEAVWKNMLETEAKVQHALQKDPTQAYVEWCRPERLHWVPYFPNKRPRV